MNEVRKIKCQKCGAEIDEKANFCAYCGTKLKEVCNCWMKKNSYNCGESNCLGYKLPMIQKSNTK